MDPPLSRRASHLAKAQQAHVERRFAEAVVEYAAFIDAGGSASDVGAAYGDVLIETGDLRGAIAAYAVPYELDAGDVLAASRLGRAAQWIGDYDLARAAWRRVAADALGEINLPLGGERPLPERLDEGSAELLLRRGWPAARLFADPPTSASSSSPAGLGLVELDPLPALRDLRLVTSLILGAWDGGASLRRAARIAQGATTGESVIVAHVGEARSGELQALRHLAQAWRLNVCLAVHADTASPRAMRNLDLSLAAACEADALLLDQTPDIEGPEFAGVFLSDPLLGFACWRPDAGRPAGIEPRPAAWRYGGMQAAPVTLIRDRVLLEVGGLDAVFEDAGTALLDFMLRANRMGFSAISSAAPASGARVEERAPDPVDLKILGSRHPEHRGFEHRASSSPAREVERLSSGLTRPRSLALDLTAMRVWYDGTAELGAALTRSLAARSDVDLTIICPPEVAQHHGLADLPGVEVVPPDTARVFCACLRIGNPFTWEEVLRTWSYAPIAGFYLLDAISLDVERLNHVDLETLSRIAFGHSELMGHLSSFTRSQMGERFGRDGSRGFVSLCSTAADEYGVAAPAPSVDGPTLLVGNTYEHKNLMGAVRRLQEVDGSRPLMVLGGTGRPLSTVTWLDSGSLTPERLNEVFAEASTVVFPSLYEGFGLPIMHGLARGKPVLAVDQPVFREIKARSKVGANLHLFPTTESLALGLDAVRRGGLAPPAPTVREHRWSDAARTVMSAVREAVSGFQPEALERRAAVASLARPQKTRT